MKFAGCSSTLRDVASGKRAIAAGGSWARCGSRIPVILERGARGRAGMESPTVQADAAAATPCSQASVEERSTAVEPAECARFAWKVQDSPFIVNMPIQNTGVTHPKIGPSYHPTPEGPKMPTSLTEWRIGAHEAEQQEKGEVDAKTGKACAGAP